MEIIGLSGYARSGKDEAANILVEEYGFARVAFADKLREVVYQLNPLVNVKAWKSWMDDDVQTTYVYLQDVIDTYGWDGYKASEYGPEIRRLLQRMGTEAGRQTMWDSIWIDTALKPYEGSSAKVVVTDCRFPNEAMAITKRGGNVWRINRAGVAPAVSPDGSIHPSETSLDKWPFDVVLFNDASLETYKDNVRRVYARAVRG